MKLNTALQLELDQIAREQQANRFCATDYRDTPAACESNRNNYPLAAVLRGENVPLANQITKQNERLFGPVLGPQGLPKYYLPAVVLSRADVSVSGSAALGGNIVGTKVAPSLVEFLRPVASLAELATVLENLSSNVSIVRQSGTTTVRWIPENTNLDASNPTFQLAGVLSPKRATV